MDWSYLAGFIDGEGSIVIYTKPRKRVIINIPNTHLESINEIKRFLKVGNVHTYKRGKDHWKPYSLYHISSHKEVKEILTNLLPYLIIKKQKALQAIKMIEETDWGNELKLDVEKIRTLKKGGKSLREIGKIMGVSHVTIKKRL